MEGLQLVSGIKAVRQVLSRRRLEGKLMLINKNLRELKRANPGERGSALMSLVFAKRAIGSRPCVLPGGAGAPPHGSGHQSCSPQGTGQRWVGGFVV